jgi:hypothetical protein
MAVAELDGAAHDARIGAELGDPERVAQHGDERGAQPVVVRRE